MAKYLREILPLGEQSDVPVVKKPGSPLADRTYAAARPKGDFGGPSLSPAMNSRSQIPTGVAAERDVSAGRVTTVPKKRIGEELDEAKRATYKRKGSLRAQVKSQADIAKEKTERRKAMRGAKRETKETGEKVRFAKFKDWRSVRKSAREKVQEDLQELSLQRLGSYVDKAGAKDYEEDSTKHRKGINLALRKRGEHKHSADVPAKVRGSIKEAKSEYSKTRTAGGERPREHFYVDAGRRAGHVRDLKDMGLDARHEYSPYSNLAGLSVPKEHAKKVSQHLWPRSRKKR